MTCDEVARFLTNCAEGGCGSCEFQMERVDFSTEMCQARLISAMALEVKAIAEGSNGEKEEALQSSTQDK